MLEEKLFCYGWLDNTKLCATGDSITCSGWIECYIYAILFIFLLIFELIVQYGQSSGRFWGRRRIVMNLSNVERFRLAVDQEHHPQSKENFCQKKTSSISDGKLLMNTAHHWEQMSKRTLRKSTFIMAFATNAAVYMYIQVRKTSIL